MSKEEFISFVAKVAVKDWIERRIMLPSVVIAQACKESAFGTSELAINAKAIFGIKLNGWTGKSYLKKADEQNADGSFRTDPSCLWRAYDSWEESIVDHNTYIATRRVGNQTENNFKSIVGETDVKRVLAGLVGNKNRLETAERCTDPEIKKYVLEGKSVYPYATGLNYPQSLYDDYIIKYNLTKYDEEVVSMSKKVFIGVGHGGADPGSVKYLVEKDVNLTMALACKEVLEASGVIVKMSRTKDENDPITEEVKECHAFAPDLAIDVHNNAGGGDGFEVICSINGGNGRTLAMNIEAEVKKIGQNSRGVKTRKNSSGKDYYAFIRDTKCPAVICEGVFVDNAQDVKIADTVADQKKFGEAYARGILKTLGVTEKVTGVETTSGPIKVKVSISNLNIRSGAGTDNAVKYLCPPGIYTITEVKAGKGSSKGWGKLKSGAGWISLDFATRV